MEKPEGEAGIWSLSAGLSFPDKERALQGTQLSITDSGRIGNPLLLWKESKNLWLCLSGWLLPSGEAEGWPKDPPRRPPSPAKSNAFFLASWRVSHTFLWTLLEPWNVPASLSLGVNKLRMFTTHGESSFSFCLSSNCPLQASGFTPSVVRCSVGHLVGLHTRKAVHRPKARRRSPV